MATSDGSGQRRPCVGVLFVHGIGEQQQGATLVTWADAVIDFLRGALGADSVEVAAAHLLGDSGDPAAPAFLDVDISLPGGSDSVRWRLAEGWWAHVFGAPNFRELAVWAFVSLPYTILAHFVTSFERAWTTGGKWPMRIARVAARGVGVFVAALLAPLMALVVGIILLLGVLPIGGLRRIAGALQRSLSQSVGDSYVLLSSPSREAAIVHTVKCELEWLTGNADEVIVVAHSQGAEVAHRALVALGASAHEGGFVRRLITVGSGQTKLFMATKARELGNYWGAWFAPVGLLAIILAIFVGFQTWREFGTDTLYGTLFVVLVGLGLFGLGIAKAEGSRPSEAQLASGASDGWLDLYASHDPVPNGPTYPRAARTRVLTSRQVRNRASTLHDHTAYARNVEQVIAVIAETAAAASHRELSEHPQEARR